MLDELEQIKQRHRERFKHLNGEALENLRRWCVAELNAPAIHFKNDDKLFKELEEYRNKYMIRSFGEIWLALEKRVDELSEKENKTWEEHRKLENIVSTFPKKNKKEICCNQKSR